MKEGLLNNIFRHLFIIFVVFSVISCGATGGGIRINMTKPSKQNPSLTKKGPPAHAKAYGYKAKFQYWYYPSYSVYFDIDRKVYFYLQDDDWKKVDSLPVSLSQKLDSYVVVDLDTDKPYLHYKEHKSIYPPGKLKNRKN